MYIYIIREEVLKNYRGTVIIYKIIETLQNTNLGNLIYESTLIIALPINLLNKETQRRQMGIRLRSYS